MIMAVELIKALASCELVNNKDIKCIRQNSLPMTVEERKAKGLRGLLGGIDSVVVRDGDCPFGNGSGHCKSQWLTPFNRDEIGACHPKYKHDLENVK